MNLLITGAWQNAPQHFAEIERLGHNVEFMQWENTPLPCAPEWVEGVICNGLFLHHDIRRFPNLRYIRLTAAGYDRVDMAYVRARGITIHNAGATYAIPMSEHVVCSVLMLYRKMRQFGTNQQQHFWNKERSLCELCGRTVLIVGCGAVGQACATRFAAFGCHVLGVARSARNLPGFAQVYTQPELPALLEQADVVIPALPATPETTGLFDAAMFGRMKHGAVFVNIARGSLVHERALLDALSGGTLAGAVLDVFANEPLPPDSPLWDMPNVILTPHNSFVGEGNAARLAKLIMNNLPQVK